jgi:hypothetical protein
MLALLGLGACVAPLFLAARVTIWRFGARSVSKVAEGPSASLPAPAGVALRTLFDPRFEWIDGPGPNFVAHYLPLFEPFRRGRQWFVCVDVAVSLLFGILGGAITEGSSWSTCSNLLVAAAVVHALMLVLLLALLPYNTYYDMTLALVNAVLSLAEAAQAARGADPGGVIAAQAVVNNVAIALQILQKLFSSPLVAKCRDFQALFSASGRRIMALRHRRARLRHGAQASTAVTTLALPAIGETKETTMELRAVVEACTTALNRSLLTHCAAPELRKSIQRAQPVRHMGGDSHFSSVYGESGGHEARYRHAAEDNGVALLLGDMVRLVCAVQRLRHHTEADW